MTDIRFKGIIFDLDGTLANTLSDLKTAMNEMLTQFNLRKITQKHVLKHINHGTWNFVSGCISESYPNEKPPVSKEFIDNAIEIYSQCYAKQYCEKTHAYKGLPELCEKLKKADYVLAVLSNKPDSFTKAIVEKLYGDTFDIIMGAAEEFPAKPTPASALYIAEQSNLTPSDYAFVGDSNVDMETASNAGMYPIGVTWGYRAEDVLISHGAKTIVRTPNELEAIFLGK